MRIFHLYRAFEFIVVNNIGFLGSSRKCVKDGSELNVIGEQEFLTVLLEY
jgi:hypothetical protein